MKRSVIETIMGGVVLVLAIAFLAFAYTRSGMTKASGYEVSAKFSRVDGLVVGSDVRMSGIKIGTVTDLRLDPDTYEAVVSLSLQEDIKLPTDSNAKILSDGLLGDNYVMLDPGAEEALIEPGGNIQHTQDPVNIIELVSRYIFSSGETKPTDDTAPPTP